MFKSFLLPFLSKIQTWCYMYHSSKETNLSLTFQLGSFWSFRFDDSCLGHWNWIQQYSMSQNTLGELSETKVLFSWLKYLWFDCGRGLASEVLEALLSPRPPHNPPFPIKYPKGLPNPKWINLNVCYILINAKLYNNFDLDE